MLGTIPVFKVNYTISQLISAAFVSNRSNRYRDELRNAICRYFNVGDILFTSSARCALYMLFKYLPQNKVIVPAYTCEVVVDAARLANKKLIFAHVSKESLNVSKYSEIDSDTIVIATHQYGLPCDLHELVALCKVKKTILIEDCAGSLGSTVNGKLTGTFGDYGIFSFSASKTLQSPTRGGFIIAQDEKSIKKIKGIVSFNIDENKFKIKQLLKSFAFCLNKNSLFCSLFMKLYKKDGDTSDKAYLKDISYKTDFYEWQAYVLLKQFKNIEKYLEERKRHVAVYNEKIMNPSIIKPCYNSDSVNIRYPILVKNRDAFIRKCREASIQVGTGYLAPVIPDGFIIEKEISKEIVYLPLGAGYSFKEIEYIVSVVNSIK